MEIYQAIETRRTVHDYAPEALTAATLGRILAAAHRAPNHGLTWPWRFTVVGPETRERLAAISVALKAARGPISEAKRAFEAARITTPGALVAVGVRRSEHPFQAREDYAAVACALQNAMLAATAEGLGSKWSTSGVTTAPDTYALLGIDPEEEEIVGFLLLGTPSRPPPHIERPPLEGFVRHLR